MSKPRPKYFINSIWPCSSGYGTNHLECVTHSIFKYNSNCFPNRFLRLKRWSNCYYGSFYLKRVFELCYFGIIWFTEKRLIGPRKISWYIFHIPECFLNQAIIEIIHLSLSQDMQKIVIRKKYRLYSDQNCQNYCGRGTMCSVRTKPKSSTIP